jgi:hypothetical protein
MCSLMGELGCRMLPQHSGTGRKLTFLNVWFNRCLLWGKPHSQVFKDGKGGAC